jgi:hypothetical protein
LNLAEQTQHVTFGDGVVGEHHTRNLATKPRSLNGVCGFAWIHQPAATNGECSFTVSGNGRSFLLHGYTLINIEPQLRTGDIERTGHHMWLGINSARGTNCHTGATAKRHVIGGNTQLNGRFACNTMAHHHTFARGSITSKPDADAVASPIQRNAFLANKELLFG